MEGSSTSSELTPATEMGANCPKCFRKNGMPNNAIISRNIFDSKAIVPNSEASCNPSEGSLNWVINIDDSE